MTFLFQTETFAFLLSWGLRAFVERGVRANFPRDETNSEAKWGFV